MIHQIVIIADVFVRQGRGSRVGSAVVVVGDDSSIRFYSVLVKDAAEDDVAAEVGVGARTTKFEADEV